MHTKNGLALFAGLALSTVSISPVTADSTVQLQGAVVTEDVRVAQGGDLVVPVVGVTPNNEVLLNRDGISLRQVPTLVFADDSNTRVEGVVDVPISGDLATPRATTRGLVFPGEPNPITLGDWRAPASWAG